MGLLGYGHKETEDLVTSLGFEPNGNYLLAFSRMATVAKVMTFILFQVPSLETNAAEKQYLVIFNSEKLALHRMKKNGETRIIPKNELKNFNYRDGANNSIVFEFDHDNEHFSFYSYKDFSFRMKFVADNLKQLVANGFNGFAN